MHKTKIHKVERNIPPTILTIFGATGDLAADYLLPSLVHMHMEGLLPKGFNLVCVGRRELNTKTYLEFIIKKSAVLKKMSPKQRVSFLKILTYFRGNFENPKSFEALTKILSDRENPHKCYNRLFYFATSPQLFSTITQILKSAGLLMSCTAHTRQTRVLVEKPFGVNLGSARALNQLLLKYFTEEQIYRIDHYQGKETVQNLMVVRFANAIFEPLWNNKYIDHIEISVLEKDSAKSRAEFYDQAGALKDMVQNHILQILALVMMDEPKDITAGFIRDEKVKVLRDLGFDQAKVIKGQYQGYIKDVGHSSSTETFVAIKALVNSSRWKGVPIYLRTGKSLSKKLAEVSIHFKELDRCIFKNCAPNILTFRLQPDESVHLFVNNKIPGFGIELHRGDYEFGYNKTYMSEIPPAYERLLLDFLEGDQRLFIRSDEIEAAWKFVDNVLDKSSGSQIYKYKAGGNGPAEADKLIEGDGKAWFTK